MTWVEVIPCFGVMWALGCGLCGVIQLSRRQHYRGIFDRRVPYSDCKYKFEMDGRLAERDLRLGIYPTMAQWIHPLWRPKNYPAQE